MTNFYYVAYTNKGKKVTGDHKAETRDQVADYLHGQGLKVVEINENLVSAFSKIGSLQIGGIPINDKVIFAKQLSIMLSAGLPVLQAIGILVEQTKNASLKEKLEIVYSEIEAGSSISDAFSKDQTFFNEVQLNLMKAGEKSGNLNQMINQIAVDIEKSKSLQSKIRGAMIYPAIIFFVVAIVMVVVVVFMIPSVEDLYADLGGGELPAVTQVLVNLSDLVTNPIGAITIILLTVFSLVGSRYYYSTPPGKKNIDRLLLKAPVFGPLINKMQVTQFCRLLSMLMKSGVPIVSALQIVANATSNAIYREVILHASVEVTKGTPISLPLALNKVFPDILLKIIATGEDTGKLDQVLEDMSNYYGAEVDEITSNLTKLMEPIILLVVGGIVAFIAVAVYLPIYGIGEAIG